MRLGHQTFSSLIYGQDGKCSLLVWARECERVHDLPYVHMHMHTHVLYMSAFACFLFCVLTCVRAIVRVPEGVQPRPRLFVHVSLQSRADLTVEQRRETTL